MVITNFGSIVLDDHSSRKIYIPKMIVDIQSYIHLRWSCYLLLLLLLFFRCNLCWCWLWIKHRIRVAELGSLSSGAKMVMKIFVKSVFTIFATNSSLRGAKKPKLSGPCYLMRVPVPSLAECQFWGSPHLLDVSFEGPLTCTMSVLRVPSLAGCQFWGSPHLLDVSFEGPLTCRMSVFRGSPHLLGCHVVLILVKIGS